MKVSLPLMLCLLVAACAKVPTFQKPDEVTITLNDSASQETEDGLPPFGPDVSGGTQEEAAPAQPEEVVEETQEVEAIAEDPVAEAVIQEEVLLENTGKARIALLLPFTSPNKNIRSLAKTLEDAALLALFDQRNSTIQLTPYDTGGTTQGAAQAAKLAAQEGATVILGPLMSPSVAAVSVIARGAGIPMLAFNNRLDSAGKGVYILGNSPRFEVETVMDYAQTQGITRVLALVPNDTYGNIVAETARAHASIRGMTITRVAYYDPSATDYSELIKDISGYRYRRQALLDRIAELEAREDEAAQKALVQLEQKETLGAPPFEAILLPALNQFTLRTLAAQLSHYEVDQPAVRFLGLAAWDDMGNLSNEPPLVGSWYASHPDQGWNRFAKHYKKRLGYVPINLTSIAYEAVALSSLLAGREFKPDFSAEKLHVNKGYQGVRGMFRLSPLGYAERLLAIKQIGKKQAEILSPAATSFEQVLN